MSATAFAFAPRRGLDPAVIAESIRRHEALRDARGAGGAAPGVGGVTHPRQSAATPEPVALAPLAALPLGEGERGPHALDRLHRVGQVFAFSAADLEGVDTDRPVRDIQPAAVRWGVPAPSPEGPACVARGVDTLHLCIYADLAPHVVDVLADLLKLARQGREDKPVFLVAGGLAFRVTWTRPPYLVALDGAGAHLRIARAIGPNAPQVYAEVRAGLLWRDGPVAAVERLRQLVRNWEVPREKETRFDVARIDLAADFTGLGFTGAELADGRWVTRARNRGAFDTPDRADSKAKRAAAADARERMEADRHSATYVHGRKHTGTTFGRGDVVVRCYDKEEEIRCVGPAGKVWFRDLWRAAGWDGRARVFRVEAQIRGPALASMLAVAHATTSHGRGRGASVWPAGAVTAGKGWAEVVRALDGLWRYVVGEPGGGHGWITLRDPDGSPQPTRWPVSPVWRAVQAVPFEEVAEVYGGRVVGVARVRQKPNKRHEAAYQEGMPWAPSPAVPLPPRPTAREVARAVDAPQGLATWRDGPATKADSAQLDTMGQAVTGERFDIACAEERGAMMRGQVIGGGAAWAAALSVAAGVMADDPVEAARGVAQLIVEAAQADPPAFAERVRKAKVRASMRGSVLFRRELLVRSLAVTEAA